MTDQPEPPPVPELPPGENHPHEPIPKIIWVFVAFLPSLAALVLFQKAYSGPVAEEVLLIFGLICCLAAGIGLVSGMNHIDDQIALGIFLTGFFFVANLVIVVLIGCSHMRDL